MLDDGEKAMLEEFHAAALLLKATRGNAAWAMAQAHECLVFILAPEVSQTARIPDAGTMQSFNPRSYTSSP